MLRIIETKVQDISCSFFKEKQSGGTVNSSTKIPDYQLGWAIVFGLLKIP